MTTDDLQIDNALPATTVPRRGITYAPPFDRPPVTVLVERRGSRRPVTARALAWTEDAVRVQLDQHATDPQWFPAECVTRR